MSEFMERNAVARLVGAPPGYVGYEEGGQLTEAVRRRPYAVLLLDEVEKAHPEVFNLLLQVLDDGRLTDSQGRTVDFCHTVVIMTSNLASRAILENARQNAAANEPQAAPPTNAQVEQPNHSQAEQPISAQAAPPTSAQAEQPISAQAEQPPELQRRLEQAVEQALASHFRPEFLNRIDEVIRFRPLDRGDLQRIVRLQLAELAGLLAEQQLRLEVSEPVVQMLVSQGYEPEYGARPLRRVLRRRIENPLATALLAESFSGASAVRVELGNDQDPQLRFLAIP